MKKLSDTELTKLLADTRGELRALRFEAAAARPKDTNAPRNARRTVARIHTEIRARAGK